MESSEKGCWCLFIWRLVLRTSHRLTAGEKEHGEDVEPAEASALLYGSHEGPEAAVTSGHLSK